MAARIPALNPLYVKLVGALLIAMGLLSLAKYGAMPWSMGEGAGSPVKIVDSDEGFAYISESSSYVTQFYIFSLGVLVVWVASFGLRYWVTATLIPFIFLMVYNGSVSGRNTYVISGYAIVLALMARTRRSWPSLLSMIALILICLSFMMGKHWLKSIVEGHGRDPAGPPVAVADTPFSESDIFINYDMFLTITTLIPDLADHTHFSLYEPSVPHLDPQGSVARQADFRFPRSIHSVPYQVDSVHWACRYHSGRVIPRVRRTRRRRAHGPVRR